MKFIIYIKRRNDWEYHSECQTQTFLAMVLERLKDESFKTKFKIKLNIQ